LRLEKSLLDAISQLSPRGTLDGALANSHLN
jgi:hypothetical protein